MNSKKFIAMLCAFACMISVSSCGLVQSSEDDDDAAETTAAETTTAAEGESTDTATETTTAETTTTETTTTTVTTPTADWTSFSFTFDGADVQLPLTISEFEEATGAGVSWERYSTGWFGSGSKLDDDAKYSISQYCDLEFSVPEYVLSCLSEFQVYLTSDDDTRLKDAVMTGFDFSIASVSEGEMYPSVELPGGITWGSTADEIKAAYGEPFYETTSTTDSKGDIQEMKYSGNKGSSLTLYVYAEGGLKRMIESASS